MCVCVFGKSLEKTAVYGILSPNSAMAEGLTEGRLRTATTTSQLCAVILLDIPVAYGRRTTACGVPSIHRWAWRTWFCWYVVCSFISLLTSLISFSASALRRLNHLRSVILPEHVDTRGFLGADGYRGWGDFVRGEFISSSSLPPVACGRNPRQRSTDCRSRCKPRRVLEVEQRTYCSLSVPSVHNYTPCVHGNRRLFS